MSRSRKHVKTGLNKSVSGNAYGKACQVDNHKDTSDDKKEASSSITPKAKESVSSIKWNGPADRNAELSRYEEYGIKFKRNQNGMSILTLLEKITRNKKNRSL